jgi:sialidase-1
VLDSGKVDLLFVETAVSSFLHLPWYVLFSADLTNGRHLLKLTIDETKNANSKGTACRIVHFLVNR